MSNPESETSASTGSGTSAGTVPGAGTGGGVGAERGAGSTGGGTNRGSADATGAFGVSSNRIDPADVVGSGRAATTPGRMTIPDETRSAVDASPETDSAPPLAIRSRMTGPGSGGSGVWTTTGVPSGVNSPVDRSTNRAGRDSTGRPTGSEWGGIGTGWLSAIAASDRTGTDRVRATLRAEFAEIGPPVAWEPAADGPAASTGAPAATGFAAGTGVERDSPTAQLPQVPAARPRANTPVLEIRLPRTMGAVHSVESGPDSVPGAHRGRFSHSFPE